MQYANLIEIYIYCYLKVNSVCPMCRAPLDSSQIVEAKAKDLEPDEQIDISVENFKHSSKVHANIYK